MTTTLSGVGYAKITKDETTGSDTYGTIIKFESEVSGGREFSAEPKGEVTEIYADGKLVKSVEANDGYDTKLILIDLIDDVNKDWLGNTVAVDGSVAEYAKATSRPHFALVTMEETDEDEKKVTVYYNCQVSKRPAKGAKTSEGKFDPQFKEFAISCKPRATDKLVCYEKIVTEFPTEIPQPTV